MGSLSTRENSLKVSPCYWNQNRVNQIVFVVGTSKPYWRYDVMSYADVLETYWFGVFPCTFQWWNFHSQLSAKFRELCASVMFISDSEGYISIVTALLLKCYTPLVLSKKRCGCTNVVDYLCLQQCHAFLSVRAWDSHTHGSPGFSQCKGVDNIPYQLYLNPSCEWHIRHIPRHVLT